MITNKGTRGTLNFVNEGDGALRIISGMPIQRHSWWWRQRRRLAVAFGHIMERHV